MPWAKTSGRNLRRTFCLTALTLTLAFPLAATDGPEEPDFAFIAGGPYTQKRTSPQFVYSGQWGRRISRVGGMSLQNSACFGAPSTA